MDSKPTKQTERWHFLDAIRGIAALAVVLQHFLWFADPRIENFFATVWSPGRFGVVAFFIVSGFIVPRSLEIKKDVKAFWMARFFRLFPPYWASLLLIAIVQFLGIEWHPPFSGKVALQWLVNLTMLQGFAKIPDINPVAWTLGIEMLFYVAITGLFMFGVMRRSWLITGVLLGSLWIASVIMPTYLHIRFPAGAAAVGGSIVAGLALYRYFNGEIKRWEAIVITGFCLLVTEISAFANYSPTRITPDSIQPTQLAALTSVATGYAFFLLMLCLRNREFPQWLLWLGKVSYSLYLLHVLPGMIVPTSIGHWPQFALRLVLSIILAWVGYKYLEEPSMALVRKLNKRREMEKANVAQVTAA